MREKVAVVTMVLCLHLGVAVDVVVIPACETMKVDQEVEVPVVGPLYVMGLVVEPGDRVLVAECMLMAGVEVDLRVSAELVMR